MGLVHIMYKCTSTDTCIWLGCSHLFVFGGGIFKDARCVYIMLQIQALHTMSCTIGLAGYNSEL